MRLRWSLRTQLLGMLCVVLLSLIWVRRHAWSYEQIEDTGARQQFETRPVSPDGTREISKRRSVLGVYDAPYRSNASQPLQQFLSRDFHLFSSGGFVDDDTIACRLSRDPELPGFNKTYYALCRRRFPEWWWGHFYRPEVWLLPLMLGLLIWSIRKDHAVRA